MVSMKSLFFESTKSDVKIPQREAVLQQFFK